MFIVHHFSVLKNKAKGLFQRYPRLTVCIQWCCAKTLLVYGICKIAYECVSCQHDSSPLDIIQ